MCDVAPILSPNSPIARSARAWVRSFRKWGRVAWLCICGALTAGAAETAERVIVFGTVERMTPRGAPVHGLDDAAFDQDLAELVAKAAGLPYRLAEYKTAPAVMAAFERGEIDVIPSLARLPEREGKYLFSVRHTVTSAAVFMRVGSTAPESPQQVAELRLAVVQESSPYSYFRRKGWLDRIQLFPTTEEAMRAVQQGSVQACVSNQLIGLSVLRQLKLEGRIIPVYTLPDFSVDFCMAVRPADTDLLSRLNDGLLLASERGDLVRHREKWLPVFESYWLSRRDVRRWLGIGASALILIAGLTWLWYRTRLRAEQRTTEKVTTLVGLRTAELEAANRKLKASEELFSAAFVASPDALSIARAEDGRLLDVNPAFTRIFGYERTEAVGRTLTDLGFSSAPDGAKSLGPGSRRPGRVREAIQQLRCKDGKEIELMYSSELTTLGGVECCVTLSRDITEQKRATDALRRGHAFNEAILQTVDGLVIVLDRQGKIVRFNPACERITGWTAAEATGRCLWDFLVPPDQIESVRSVFDSLTKGKFPRRHEDQWLARNGSRRWIAWASSALVDSAGEVELVLGTGVDITAMRQMTEALRASEERFQLAVRGSSAGIWDWNILTDEVFYAPRFREMIGQEIEAGFPSRISSFWEVLHPEDRSAVQAALAASLSPQNTPYDVEYRMRTRTGGDRWFHARGEVLRDNQGQPYRMAGSITDITWRKEVENELRHLNAELEKRVHERTTELAKRIVEVEQLNGELESFSYSVSHDLRSPLRNITGFIELLEGRLAGRLELDEKRYFATVTREAGRLRVLIDDLLAFSRMGRAQMKLGPVPLVDLVQEVRAELVSNAAARPIEWKIADLPVVEGDRALLRLALVNLLGNAFKFTKQRPLAVIEIGIHGSGAEDSGRIAFFVRDNGAGFNPKYQDKLFGVFQRLHNAREFEGTGIGLANVKRIIERHGGRVWAEGTVNHGAVFYFTLRLFDRPSLSAP